MKEMGRNQQLRTGEVLIIVVVLFMWAGESGPKPFFTSPWGSGGPSPDPLLTETKGEGLGGSERT